MEGVRGYRLFVVYFCYVVYGVDVVVFEVGGLGIVDLILVMQWEVEEGVVVVEVLVGFKDCVLELEGVVFFGGVECVVLEKVVQVVGIVGVVGNDFFVVGGLIEVVGGLCYVVFSVG